MVNTRDVRRVVASSTEQHGVIENVTRGDLRWLLTVPADGSLAYPTRLFISHNSPPQTQSPMTMLSSGTEGLLGRTAAEAPGRVTFDWGFGPATPACADPACRTKHSPDTLTHRWDYAGDRVKLTFRV